jgi:hypothetical protein
MLMSLSVKSRMNFVAVYNNGFVQHFKIQAAFFMRSISGDDSIAFY